MKRDRGLIRLPAGPTSTADVDNPKKLADMTSTFATSDWPAGATYHMPAAAGGQRALAGAVYHRAHTRDVAHPLEAPNPALPPRSPPRRAHGPRYVHLLGPRSRGMTLRMCGAPSLEAAMRSSERVYKAEEESGAGKETIREAYVKLRKTTQARRRYKEIHAARPRATCRASRASASVLWRRQLRARPHRELGSISTLRAGYDWPTGVGTAIQD